MGYNEEAGVILKIKKVRLATSHEQKTFVDKIKELGERKFLPDIKANISVAGTRSVYFHRAHCKRRRGLLARIAKKYYWVDPMSTRKFSGSQHQIIPKKNPDLFIQIKFVIPN